MKFFARTLDPAVVLGEGVLADQNDSDKRGEKPSNSDHTLEKTWTGEAAVASESQHAAIDSQAISPEAQHGVQKIEATTSAWSMRSLIMAYVL